MWRLRIVIYRNASGKKQNGPCLSSRKKKKTRDLRKSSRRLRARWNGKRICTFLFRQSLKSQNIARRNDGFDSDLQHFAGSYSATSKDLQRSGLENPCLPARQAFHEHRD